MSSPLPTSSSLHSSFSLILSNTRISGARGERKLSCLRKSSHVANLRSRVCLPLSACAILLEVVRSNSIAAYADLISSAPELRRSVNINMCSRVLFAAGAGPHAVERRQLAARAHELDARAAPVSPAPQFRPNGDNFPGTTVSLFFYVLYDVLCLY